MKIAVGCLLSVVISTASANICDSYREAITEFERYKTTAIGEGETYWIMYDAHKQQVREMKELCAEEIENEKKFKSELEALEKLRGKPYPKIGMTDTQVLYSSSWGKPLSVNKTTTSRETNEQWVYKDNEYLYFTNGKLTAIQEKHQ